MALIDEEGSSTPEMRWVMQPWVVRVLDDAVREAVRDSTEGLIGDYLVSTTPFDFSLDSVQCRVYAVHGAADTWEPLTNLRRILDQLDSELILLDRMGHLGPYLHPDLVLALAVGARDY